MTGAGATGETGTTLEKTGAGATGQDPTGGPARSPKARDRDGRPQLINREPMSHNQLINMSQNGRPRGRHRTGDAEPGITVTHRLTGDSVTREGPSAQSLRD